MTKRKKRGCSQIERSMREKNDCTSRVIPSHESIDQLAIEMRVKRFGLTIEEAKNPLSGTYIGRLCLFGYRQDALSISQGQYDAAQKYLEVRNDYSCAKGLPSAVYDEMPSSSDDKAREKWVERATEQFCNMQKVLKEAQCLYRQHNLYAALQYLVMEDQELPHLVNALRIALNTLQKYRRTWYRVFQRPALFSSVINKHLTHKEFT